MLPAQNIAPKPAALPPPVQPSLSANSAGGPSFAQFLTNQSSPPTPPAAIKPDAEPDAEPSHADAAAEPEPAQATSATAAQRRANAQPGKPAAQNHAAQGLPNADAKAVAAGKAEAPLAADTVAADEDDAPETPELKEFTQLIAMNVATPEAATAARPDAQRGRAATVAGDAAQDRSALRGAATDSARAADKPEPAAAKPGNLRADKATAGDSTESVQVTTRQTGSDPAGAAPAPAAPSFAAVFAQALPTPAVLADATQATTYADVRAPLHGQAFAPELCARVSLMAVDGVQHAELQLNPADMGPVTVQIVVDGSQAQVSFHALQAETRQALEQSLPDLAAALQGQGLTLSGGGVFQQAQRDANDSDDGAQADNPSRAARGGNDRIAGTAGGTPAQARRTVGLLDTFA